MGRVLTALAKGKGIFDKSPYAVLSSQGYQRKNFDQGSILVQQTGSLQSYNLLAICAC
jgi:hypothetical protein